jgi:hypothetical protein
MKAASKAAGRMNNLFSVSSSSSSALDSLRSLMRPRAHKNANVLLVVCGGTASFSPSAPPSSPVSPLSCQVPW